MSVFPYPKTKQEVNNWYKPCTYIFFFLLKAPIDESLEAKCR